MGLRGLRGSGELPGPLKEVGRHRHALAFGVRPRREAPRFPASGSPARPRRLRATVASRSAKAPPAVRRGSMAMKSWPVLGGPPSGPEKGLACRPGVAPVRHAAISSTRSAAPTPFAPPEGIMVPRKAAAPSVVGRPSSSSAQPGGIGSPALAFFITSLFATTLALWSMTKTAPPRPSGAATDHGFVPSTGFSAPQGAMEAGALVKPSPTRFSARDPLGVVAQHAAIVGIADRQKGDALLARGRDQRFETQVDRGMGEARHRIDDDHPRRRAFQGRRGLAVHLAAAQVLAVGREIHEAVGADAVPLRCGDRLRQAPGLPFARPVRLERPEGQALDLGNREHDRLLPLRPAHRLSSFGTAHGGLRRRA